MSWNDILGQKHAIGLLRTARTTDRLSHAYLFTGPDGTGKDAVALELAKVLNCDTGKDDACGTCRSCLAAARLEHPDIHLVFAMPIGKNEVAGDSPTEKLSTEDLAALREERGKKAANPYHDISIPRATVIKMNSIRELRRSASLSASGPGKKVYVISDAEAMNDEASNALLKTLEEPHPDSLFILTSAYPDRLLPTIVSRCQRVTFEAFSRETIESALITREGATEPTARMAAMLAQGSYARGLKSISEPLQARRDEAVEFLRGALSRSKVNLVVLIDRFGKKKDRVEAEQCLLLLQAWIRDGMNLRHGRMDIVNVDDHDKVKLFADHYTSIDFGKVFESIDRAISLLSRNVYIPLIFTALAVELRRAIR